MEKYCPGITRHSLCRLEKNGEGAGPKFRPCSIIKILEARHYQELPKRLRDCLEKIRKKKYNDKAVKGFVEKAEQIFKGYCPCPKTGDGPPEECPIGVYQWCDSSSICCEESVLRLSQCLSESNESLKKARKCFQKYSKLL